MLNLAVFSCYLDFSNQGFSYNIDRIDVKREKLVYIEEKITNICCENTSQDSKPAQIYITMRAKCLTTGLILCFRSRVSCPLITIPMSYACCSMSLLYLLLICYRERNFNTKIELDPIQTLARAQIKTSIGRLDDPQSKAQLRQNIQFLNICLGKPR